MWQSEGMRIRVGYDLASDCPEVAPMVPEVTTHYTRG
jgi:hypothetical protein